MKTDRAPDVISFEKALEASGVSPRAVLLGNGFSIAQGGNHFSYSSLLDRCGLPPDGPIRNVFKALQTVDFEEVMRALREAARIEAAYGDAERSKKFREDAEAVRESLIHAVRDVHPGVHFDVPQAQRDACASFLNKFQNIFTLNYDLLMYWVILHAGRDIHSDGFGLGQEVEGFRTFSTQANCTTHYLHGALHLFLDDRRETLKRILTHSTIIDDIARTIRQRGQLPLFVAEGSTVQKLARINSVPYLRHCHDKLGELQDDLFVFGHSAGPNDRHIYDAIFSSKIKRIFFCIHNPERDWGYLRERMAPFIERRPNVEISYVDAATAKVWGAN